MEWNLKDWFLLLNLKWKNNFTKVNIYPSLILQRLLDKGALLHNLVATKLEPLFLYKNQHHWIRAFVGSL